MPIKINYLEAQAFSANKSLPIDGWDSLRQVNLISVLGRKFVENNLKKRNIECNFLPTFTQAMGMLNRGRADVAVFPRIVGIKASREANTPDVVPVGQPLSELGLFHYINKKHQSIVNKLAVVLQQMEDSGRLKEIRAGFITANNF